MDNSVYVALSRQLGVFRDMAATANNIANVDTVGYHAEKVIFTDFLVDDGNSEDIAFAQDISSYRVETNGPIQSTGGQFDVAIDGPGFFRVETPAGERFTRAGNFKIDPNGVLVTPDGFPVQGNGGQIVIPAEVRNIIIGENGAISTNDGQQIGQLGIAEFADPQELSRVNSQLYRTDQPPLAATESRVLHGALEGSNVQPVIELVKTTRLSRATASTAQFIEIVYDLQRRTSNTYARNNSQST